MPHIHTEPGQHDLTASAYIVRIDQQEPRLLLHKHKILGVFLQFGGHVELKETPWQAVVHEILEETGYEITQLSLLQPESHIRYLSSVDLHPHPVVALTHPFDDNHFHTDIAWAFVVDQPPKHAVGEGESSGLQLFNRQELVSLEPGLIPENVREIGLFVLDTCLNDWERMPLTA